MEMLSNFLFCFGTLKVKVKRITAREFSEESLNP